MDVKAILRIAYSNQNSHDNFRTALSNLLNLVLLPFFNQTTHPPTKIDFLNLTFVIKITNFF
jgi:hypothetical protein